MTSKVSKTFLVPKMFAIIFFDLQFFSFQTVIDIYEDLHYISIFTECEKRKLYGRHCKQNESCKNQFFVLTNSITLLPCKRYCKLFQILPLSEICFFTLFQLYLDCNAKTVILCIFEVKDDLIFVDLKNH